MKLNEILMTSFKSFCAGAMLIIGCTMLLNIDNLYVGSVLFAVGLSGILALGLCLYTGAIGYIDGRQAFYKNIIILCGNILGCIIAGFLVGAIKPDISMQAYNLAVNRTLGVFDGLVSSTFCGFLMFTAVHTYKLKGSFLGVMLCVPVFILGGFEHSIAYAGFVSLGRAFTHSTVATIIICVIGNGIGAYILRKASDKLEVQKQR